jgi:hypothetical protein
MLTVMSVKLIPYPKLASTRFTVIAHSVPHLLQVVGPSPCPVPPLCVGKAVPVYCHFHQVLSDLYDYLAAKRQRSAGNFKQNSINIRMQISPITTQSITVSQTVNNNRLETTRREYTDNGGRVEVKETSYYYTVYDAKGQVEESQPNTVDLRV